MISLPAVKGFTAGGTIHAQPFSFPSEKGPTMSQRNFPWVAALAVSWLAACAGEASPPAAAPTAAPTAASAAVSPAALPGQGHWLIGTWRGNLVGARIVEDPGRTLRVRAVDPSGRTASGTWQGQPVEISISGSTVRFTTSANNALELSYTAPATLAGNFGTGGRVFGVRTITMERVTVPRS
jgi:hypothetical protein